MFEIRGVLEGFYGRPWAWAEREAMLKFMSRHGFTAFFYGPKNEPLHRNRWREPYLPLEMRRFGEFAGKGRERGIEFVFGLSPLEYHYTSDEDWNTLLAKLRAAQRVGIRDFMLLMDDMPERFRYEDDAERFGSLAAAQAWLCNRLQGEISGRLYFCPTEYHGTGDSPYLRELGEKLEAGIEVFWTGRQVCSPVLETQDARQISRTLGRSVLYWDNYPVNDLDMRFHPHLRPYRGRHPDLPTACKGIVLNAALQPEASKIALHTAAQYFQNPPAYEPESAWEKALLEVCGDPQDAEAVRTLADLARHNPLEPGQHLDNRLRSRLENFWAEPPTPERIGEMRGIFAHLSGVARRLGGLENRALAENLAPWTEKLKGWAEVGRLGLDVLADPSEEKIEGLLEVIRTVRESFYWVAGDMLEVFARRCAWATLSGENP